MGRLNLPRPLLAALVLVVVFGAVWMTALRPHAQTATQTPASTPPAASAPASHPATAKAASPTGSSHGAAGTHRTAGTRSTAGKPKAKPARVAHHSAARRHKAAHGAAVTVLSSARTKAAVDAALRSGKVLALLLFNPAGSDDRADLKSLDQVSTHGNAVVKLAAPISTVAKLASVTTNVQVTTSPTLLIVDHHHEATSITGFVDPLEYEQAVAAALAAGK